MDRNVNNSVHFYEACRFTLLLLINHRNDIRKTVYFVLAIQFKQLISEYGDRKSSADSDSLLLIQIICDLEAVCLF